MTRPFTEKAKNCVGDGCRKCAGVEQERMGAWGERRDVRCEVQCGVCPYLKLRVDFTAKKKSVVKNRQ